MGQMNFDYLLHLFPDFLGQPPLTHIFDDILNSFNRLSRSLVCNNGFQAFFDQSEVWLKSGSGSWKTLYSLRSLLNVGQIELYLDLKLTIVSPKVTHLLLPLVQQVLDLKLIIMMQLLHF